MSEIKGITGAQLIARIAAGPDITYRAKPGGLSRAMVACCYGTFELGYGDTETEALAQAKKTTADIAAKLAKL